MKNITKNQKSLAIVSLVFVSMFVCATIFGTKTVYAVVPVPNIAIEPTSEKPYVLETPIYDFSFGIGEYSNGSYYAINGSNGNNFMVSTNYSYIINTITSSYLTSGRTSEQIIRTIGEVTLTNSIEIVELVDYQFTESITLSDDANCDMFILKDDESGIGSVTIEGIGRQIKLFGNSAGQDSTSRCIYIHAESDPPNYYTNYSMAYPNFKFKNLHIVDFYSQGIYLNFNGYPLNNFGMDNVNVQICGGSEGVEAVYIESAPDSYWNGGVIQGSDTEYGLYLQGCTYSEFKGMYVNGFHRFDACTGLTFKPLIMDIGSNNHVLTLGGCKACVISPNIIHRFGGTDNTYDAIYLETIWDTYYCTNNIIANINFYSSDTSYQFRYGAHETDSNQDGNLYYGLAGATTECQTAVVRKLGTNSLANSATIIGTIATS